MLLHKTNLYLNKLTYSRLSLVGCRMRIVPSVFSVQNRCRARVNSYVLIVLSIKTSSKKKTNNRQIGADSFGYCGLQEILLPSSLISAFLQCTYRLCIDL